MCEHCGCESEAKVTATNLQTGTVTVLHTHERPHVHADGTRHVHHAGSRHSHDHEESGLQTVDIGARVLAKNDALAASNRAWFSQHQILALNLMSAPGAGKTTLLERTIRDLKTELLLYVLEGDQATTNDADRIRRAGANVVQVNTGTGCHLDAHMIAHGLEQLNPSAGSVVFIENVGNLVCPALFDLGERRKIAILSVAEGDDKPLKYPHMFREADLVVINKLDLLPHVDFDMERATAYAREVNPDVVVLSLAARAGAGLDAWYAWLRSELAAAETATTA
jgi:hydrogenase nickel incorporation protein HypB